MPEIPLYNLNVYGNKCLHPSLLCILVLLSLVFALRVVLKEVMSGVLLAVVTLGQLDDVIQGFLDILLLIVRPFVLFLLK